MKTVLALDLSTKSGWAYFEDGKLIKYGTVFSERKASDFGDYPYSYILFADHVYEMLLDELGKITFHTENKNEIVIEETTSSKNNYSQKILEYIHYKVVGHFYLLKRDLPIKYVRTGVWRRTVGATQTKEERNYNAKIARQKRSTGKRLAKIDGKVVRKLNRKDSALRVFKKEFGIELTYKDNDACDAALLGLAYLRGASVCDGTINGGT